MSATRSKRRTANHIEWEIPKHDDTTADTKDHIGTNGVEYYHGDAE